MIKIILLSMIFIHSSFACKDRIEVGAKEYVQIKELGINFLSRIDSGARITSLHAMNIKLEGEKPFIYVKTYKKLSGLPFEKIELKNKEYKHNIGHLISFDTMNEKGETKHLRARVINVVKVRNAQGIEYRYVIRLGLEYKGVLKYKDVNLRDRTKMSYKLLIGRNWLNDDFIIKTDRHLIH